MAGQLGAGGRMRIRVTQQAFDEAVKETMDDFEMEFDEAVQETVEQFQTQGVDLSGLRLDDPETRAEQGKALANACEAVRAAIGRVEAGEASAATEAPGLMAALEKLETEASDEECRNAASSHGAVPAVGRVLIWCLSQPELCQRALRVMKGLFKAGMCRENLSQSIMNSIVAAVSQHKQLQLDGLLALSAACLKDEPNKNRMEEADKRYQTIDLMLQDSDTQVVVAACELVRRLVTRDDTREMMDNCFNRSKNLKNWGVLATLAGALPKYREDMETMPAILSCLAGTCLQQDTIDVLVSNNLVEIAVELLQTHMDLQPVAENAIAMVAALAQSDKPKKVIGQGFGLPLLLTALDKYRSSGRAALRAIKGLAHLTLRAPETSTRMHELGGIPLVLDVARSFSCVNRNAKKQTSNAKIQCALCLCLRNMVSHNKELIPAILDEGAEDQIRLESVHPDVNESAFSTLKELECTVPLVGDWGKNGYDPFKQGTGEASKEMKEFLSEYRDENARNMIEQAGMADQIDVAKIPKMGGTASEDKPHIDDCDCCH